MNEQAFSFLEASAVEDVAPHREESLGQGRRLDGAEPVRHRQALGGRSGAKLGIAAPGHQRADLVADDRSDTAGPSAAIRPATSRPGMSLVPGGGS
jgi:hypothetical protein